MKTRKSMKTLLLAVLSLSLLICLFGVTAFAQAAPVSAGGESALAVGESSITEEAGDKGPVSAEGEVAREQDEEKPGDKVKFSTERIADTLPVMGYGMLGIFIVIAIICLVVIVLNKLFPPKEKE